MCDRTCEPCLKRQKKLFIQCETEHRLDPAEEPALVASVGLVPKVPIELTPTSTNWQTALRSEQRYTNAAGVAGN
jgi:hypothetical protein